MRSPHHYNFPGQDGLTLTELLVVIIIISVVAAFALMNRGSADAQFKRQDTAHNLKVALERARFDSAKRRPEACADRAKVMVYSDRFELWTDVNNNGTPESAEKIVTNLPNAIALSSYTTATLPVTFSYNRLGEVTVWDNTNAIIATPGFYVCNISCSTHTDANANLLLVTKTGTVNLLPGSASAPTFGSSGSSTVATTTEINPNLILPASAVTTCP